ncbi:MAG: hypothetical protein M1830_006467, partial [Pleopsidium flavum]
MESNGGSASSEPAEPALPRVRIEGGDVIVFLSCKEDDTLLLPSEGLKQKSCVFAASLSSQWSAPETLHESKLPVWCYGLLFDRECETWSLERITTVSTNSHDEDTKGVVPRLYTTMIPEYGSTGSDLTVTDARAHAVSNHVALFNILFGRNIAQGCTLKCDWLMRLADLAVLADFYGTMPIIAPMVETALLEMKGIWESVSRHSAFYLGLAYLIRSQAFFEDAMRHFAGLGSYCLSCLKHSVLPIEVKILAQQKHTGIVRTISAMDHLLYNIDLELNKPFFKDCSSRREQAKFLVRGIWLDWLACSTSGGNRTKLGGGVPYLDLYNHAEKRYVNFLGKSVAHRAAVSYQRKEFKTEIVYALHEHLRRAHKIIIDHLFHPDAPAARHEVLDKYYITSMQFLDDERL